MPEGGLAAPLGEGAGPIVAVGDDTGAVVGTEAPSYDNPVFRRTDTIEHSWRNAQRGSVSVAFELSYSAPEQVEGEAAEVVSSNWEKACKTAREVCEGADLATEEGFAACDDKLRSRLDSALFANANGMPVGQVERVIWKRVVWQ